MTIDHCATLPEAEATLWRNYWADRNKADRDRLVELNLDAARKIARREYKRLRGLLSFEDCESFAFEGLVGAVESWNPTRGTWERHCDFCVRFRGIAEGVRYMNGRPKAKRPRLEQVSEERLFALVERGRVASDGEPSIECRAAEFFESRETEALKRTPPAPKKAPAPAKPRRRRRRKKSPPLANQATV